MGIAISSIIGTPALVAGGVVSAIAADKLKKAAKDTAYQYNSDIKKARMLNIITASVLITLGILLFLLMIFAF